MKSTGAGGRGGRRSVIETSSGVRFPLRRLQGAHEVSMELRRPPRAPAPVLFIRLAAPKIPDGWQPYLSGLSTA